MHTSPRDSIAPELQPVIATGGLRLEPAASEDVLSGVRELQRMFLRQPARTAERGEHLAAQSGNAAEVILLASGFAYRACAMPDGRRAIIDILTSGDVLG